MANPSRDKGTRMETTAKRYLQASGWPQADRQPLRGDRDQGGCEQGWLHGTNLVHTHNLCQAHWNDTPHKVRNPPSSRIFPFWC